MSQLRLHLLGSPRIEHNGAPIQVDTRKAIALLAYLAVSGESYRRDTLAVLLWPEADQTRARAALRRTLSALSKALERRWLSVDRHTVGLDWDAGPWTDLDRFRSLLAACGTHAHAEAEVCDACLDPLTRAVELHRGIFLDGFTLRDAPAFDDWQYSQAEAIRSELAGALERLTRCHVARRDFQSAISHCQRWLALDSMDESVHRRLMQLYYWSDQRGRAMRQYRECVRILDQELGVAPLEETTQLYQAIKEHQVPPPENEAPRAPSHGKGDRARLQTRDEAPSGVRQAEYPLVGRSAEWDALLQKYASIGTDGHLVVLEGEAGIGKTRLAEEFVAHQRSRGSAAVVARCYRGESSMAYGPFLEGLRSAIGLLDESGGRVEQLPSQWLGEAARLLPELGGLRSETALAPPLDSPGAQTRFFESISRLIQELLRGPVPGVLFVDDVHWADEATIDLLSYLARRLHGRPLYMLTTWRGEQMPADHRMRLTVAEAQRAGLATPIPLARLSLPAVTDLVKTSAPGSTSPEGLGERLYRETEGLPFFLVEYLSSLGNTESPGQDLPWPMPRSVSDLLHSRLATVSQMGRQLLDTAAVVGRSFDFDTLEEASGRSDEETVDGLELLTARGLVNEVKGGAVASDPVYDFSHEQLRALVYEETSLARRRLLHRRVAEALISSPRGRRDTAPLASLIAQHYRTAGRDAEAAEYFKIAGDHARTIFANVEAMSHFRSALVLGHPDAASLHEAVGDIQTLQGDYGAAITTYETAAALRDPASVAGPEHKLGTVYLRQGDFGIAESHFQAALTTLSETDAASQRSRLYADWSLAAHNRGQTAQAIDLAGRAVELAEAAGDTHALAQGHNIRGILARSDGDPDGARRHLELSLSLAETLSDPSARVAALNNLALACSSMGEIERAVELGEAALTLCASQGDRHREAAIHNNLADFLHAAEDSEAAMAHLKSAVAIFAEIGADAGDMQPEIWKLVEW